MKLATSATVRGFLGLILTAGMASAMAGGAAGCGPSAGGKLAVDSPMVPFHPPDPDDFAPAATDDDKDDADAPESAAAAPVVEAATAAPAPAAAPAAKPAAKAKKTTAKATPAAEGH